MITERIANAVQLIALAVAALVSGCSEGVLFPTRDGGAPRDDGIHDAGESETDASDPDGGELDAGDIADAGDAGNASDAGPTCVPLPSPEIPFSCEGDEDLCEPQGDGVTPHHDVVATWSRIEGDEGVIDIRFRAVPFRSDRSELVFVYVGNLIESPGAGFVVDEGPPAILGAAQRSYVLGDSDEPIVYPPADHFSEPLSETQFPACSMFFIGPESPLVQLRIPLNTFDELAYSIVVLNPNTSPTTAPEFTWIEAGNQLIVSQGGAPDDSGALYPYCDAPCGNDVDP